MRKLGIYSGVFGFLLGAIVSSASAAHFAVWLDGNTTPGGGGNPILTEIDEYFGTDNYTLVSTAQLESNGFLSAFDCIVVSRYATNPGIGLSDAAAANIAAYVGAPGPAQGGVVLFTDDIADDLYGTGTGDPYIPQLDTLFRNGLTYAAGTHHGYVGELNGAIMGVTANTAEMPAIGLLAGTADSVYNLNGDDDEFLQLGYDIGLAGSNNLLVAGVSFPFLDDESVTYLIDVTGANDNNVFAVYYLNEEEESIRRLDEGIADEPAILANYVQPVVTNTCSSVADLLLSAESLPLTLSQTARLQRQLTIIKNSLKRKYSYGVCEECLVLGNYLNALVRLGQLDADSASSFESCCSSISAGSCYPRGDQPGNGGGGDD